MGRPTPVHRSITPAGMKGIEDLTSSRYRRQRWDRQRRYLLRMLMLGAAVALAVLALRLLVAHGQPPAVDVSAQAVA